MRWNSVLSNDITPIHWVLQCVWERTAHALHCPLSAQHTHTHTHTHRQSALPSLNWTQQHRGRDRERRCPPSCVSAYYCALHTQRNRNCFPCTGSLQMSVTNSTASAPWIFWPAVAALSVRHRWRWRGDRCWCFCRCCSLKLYRRRSCPSTAWTDSVCTHRILI